MVSEFLQYVLECLEPSGNITYRRMFGGHAIYKSGITIALMFGDEVYFKVDDSNRADYQSMGSVPFTYSKGNKEIVISNWKLPIEILEDADKLLQWVEKSYQVALRSK